MYSTVKHAIFYWVVYCSKLHMLVLERVVVVVLVNIESLTDLIVMRLFSEVDDSVDCEYRNRVCGWGMVPVITSFWKVLHCSPFVPLFVC